MYLVGKILATRGALVAWNPVKVTMTRKGALRACTTKKHFFYENVKFGKEISGTPIYPMRGESE